MEKLSFFINLVMTNMTWFLYLSRDFKASVRFHCQSISIMHLFDWSLVQMARKLTRLNYVFLRNIFAWWWIKQLHTNILYRVLAFPSQFHKSIIEIYYDAYFKIWFWRIFNNLKRKKKSFMRRNSWYSYVRLLTEINFGSDEFNLD